MGNRQELRERFNPQPDAMCDTRTPIEPHDVLGYARIAMMAIQPSNRDVKPDTPVQAITVPDTTSSPLMNQGAGLTAGTTERFTLRAFCQHDKQGSIRFLSDRIDTMAFPKRDGRHSIEHGGGLAD